MKSLSVRPPHLDRLLERVRALDGPLIQIWAWPGAGQQAVLDTLTEDARFGQPLSLDDLSDPASLERAVETAFEGGARWLVLPAMPTLPAEVPESAGAIARLLGPGQRLVFSAPFKRPPGPLACSYVLPQELLLRTEELAGMWRDVTGTTPGRGLLERLLTATDGWYRPLRLAAEAAAAAAGSVDTDALGALPAVSSFLRHEVLGLFDAHEQDLLLRLAVGRSLATGLWRELLDADDLRRLHRLVDGWGLALDAADGEQRLPRLLAGFLERELPARWTGAARRGWMARLAAAERGRDQPVAALEHMVDVGMRGELERLLVDSWPRLLRDAPLALLGRAVGAPAAGEPVPVTLLRHLHAALVWRRPEAVEGLRELTAGRADPALAAAAGLAVQLLAGGPTPDPEPPPAESLRPLQTLAEVTAVAAGGVAEHSGDGGGAEGGQSDDAVAAALLVPAMERVSAGPAPRAGGRGADPALSPLQVLFERGLLELLRRRPALSRELERRRDLPAGWRRWLAGLPPAPLADEPSGYAVQLLGKPSVRLRRPGGRSVELRFPLRRAFQVFARLAAAPDFEASREELVEAAFHEEDEEAVEKNFHPTLSYVRRTLAAQEDVQPVELRSGVYRLDPRLAWKVDVVEFERRVEEGRRRLHQGQPEQAVALWESAWRLYGGPFLAGWDAPWISARREELARQHTELLGALGEVYERLGRLTEAMDVHRAAVIADPLQEEVHLALMRIYARQGRRNLVRRQYDQLSSLLSEELGVEPMPETTEAYHRLMT